MREELDEDLKQQLQEQDSSDIELSSDEDEQIEQEKYFEHGINLYQGEYNSS